MLPRKKTQLSIFRENWTILLMVLPAVLVTLLLAYIPMSGIILAFKEYNYRDGVFGSPWVGFENFKYFFMTGQAFLVTKNTILFNLLFMALGISFSVTVAILVAEMSGKIFKKTFQSFMFLPYFISWVVVSAFVYNFFNYETGVLNTILKSLHLSPVNIYDKNSWWYFILPVLNIWKYAGYSSIVYLAAIMGMNSEYYEAATIDGANRFQKIFKITIPLLKPTIIILLLFQLGRLLRGDFDFFYQIVGGAANLFKNTDVIDTYVFRALVNTNDITMSAAASFYQSCLCFVTIIFFNWLVKKYEKDYALF
jgi:putative aldouronate transport system permease protein